MFRCYLCRVFCSLNSNQIGDIGAKALGEALKINTSVKVLEYVDNLILEFALPELDNSRMLSFKTYILYSHGHHFHVFFSLVCNHIGDIGAKAIGEALSVNTSVAKLE